MNQALKITDSKQGASPVARGSNQSGMRAYNERLVLTLIRQYGAMAKAEIARKTGLSAQTVSVIMRSLEADGLLEKGKPVRGNVGQPSVPMNLAREGAFFLGLKVGRRSLELVLTDFLGRVTDRVQKAHAYPSPDGVVEFALGAKDTLLARLPEDKRMRVAGMGIALPYQLWDWVDALGFPVEDMAAWRTRDVRAEIEEASGFPVFLSNDASAACGAELVFGDQTKPRDFLYFFLGFFIGGGLVLNGALYAGQNGNAAALGSLQIPAPDGGYRQLVDVASLATLKAALAAAGGDGEMQWDAPQDWHLPDAVLDGWLDAASTGIAHAIISSTCVIDVGHVYIDGSMPGSVRQRLVALTAVALQQISMPGVKAPEVGEGSIGSGARALGAASLPLSERFLVDRNTSPNGFNS